MRNKLRVGTRKSALALWQTRYVIALLTEAYPTRSWQLEEVPISTIGDRRLEQALHTFGGKGAFTEELEAQLRDGRIDFAVHSLKDMPTQPAAGTVIGAIPLRASAADAWVANGDCPLAELPAGARVGTSSLRRVAQLKRLRPDIECVSIRGNVQTRLGKLQGEVDAVILAEAGLARLGLADVITAPLLAENWLPAAGQGAVAVQCRADDTELLALLAAIHDEPTAQAVGAERAFLGALEGGCQVPVGAYAEQQGETLHVSGVLLSLDGRTAVHKTVSGAATAYMTLGRQLAEAVLADGGRAIWEDVRSTLEAKI